MGASETTFRRSGSGNSLATFSATQGAAASMHCECSASIVGCSAALLGCTRRGTFRIAEKPIHAVQKFVQRINFCAKTCSATSVFACVRGAGKWGLEGWGLGLCMPKTGGLGRINFGANTCGTCIRTHANTSENLLLRPRNYRRK